MTEQEISAETYLSSPVPALTLKFHHPKDKQRYIRIKGKKLCPVKCLHIPSMETLGILGLVRKAFDSIGWFGLFHLHHPTYLIGVRILFYF